MSIFTLSIETNKDHISRKQDWIKIARELHNMCQIRQELDQQEVKLKNQLKELSNYKNAKGGGFLFTCIIRKGAVDYTQVKELAGVDLEPYRKEPVMMWKLSKV